MTTITKFLTLLAVLLTAATGAMAQGVAVTSATLAPVVTREVPVKVDYNAKEAPEGLKAIMHERMAAKAMKAVKARRVATPSQTITDANDLTGAYSWYYGQYNGGVNTDYTSVDSYGEYASNAVIKALGEKSLRITLPLFDRAIEATLTPDPDYPYFEIANGTTVYNSSSYGDCELTCVFYYEGDDTYQAGWFYGNLDLYVFDGHILVDPEVHFYRTITSGTYKGYRLGYIYAPNSQMVPNASYNGIMSYTYNDHTNDAPVSISEDEGCVVTVNNFGNYGDEAAVEINLDADGSVVVPGGQVMFQYGQDGVSYDVVLANVEEDGINNSDLTGSGDETRLTIDNVWNPYVFDLGGGYGAHSNTEILFLDGTFTYPVRRIYDLTVGETEHGTLSFQVGDEDATSAAVGQTVTVLVNSGKGYIAKELSAQAYTSFGAAQAPRRALGIGMLKDVVLTTVKADSAYTFTMPEANVEVSATYDHRALTNAMIEAIADQTWTGKAVTPTLVVKDRGYTLVEGEDYSVSYENNVDNGANTATAIITALDGTEDYYLGTASAQFSICRSIESGFTSFITNDPEHPLVYNGKPHEPKVTVRNTRTKAELVEGTDYTLSYEDNITATSAATYIVTGIGAYQGERRGQFFISQCDLSSDMISPVTGVVYNGNAQYPALTLTYNGLTLVEGDEDNEDTCDYWTTFENNTETGEATVTIDGANNFTGTVVYTFNIDAKPLTADMIAAIDDLTYNGEAQQPAPTVTLGDITLIAGTDYVVSYKDNTDAGTAWLVIASATNKNYTGTDSISFNIQKADAAVTAPTAKTDLVYTAEAQALLNAGSVTGGTMQYSLDGETWADAVSTGTNAGDYTVYYKVVGDKNHKDVDAQSIAVSVDKAALTTATLTQATFTYNKQPQTAEVKEVKAGSIAVTSQDYEVVGDTRTDVGTYTATITAKDTVTNNFKGSVTAQFSIVEADAKVFKLDLAPESFVYNGKAQQPEVTVLDGDDFLKENKDYTLAFENNTDAGTAKVVATGKGNYTGTQEATFTIQKANAAVTAAPVAVTLTYNRKAQELVTAATGTGGTMMYSTDGKTFSDAVPTGTDAGAYTVSYFVLGDKNHNNTDTLTVSSSIQKAQATMAFAETNYDLTYGDANFTNSLTVEGDNTIHYVSSKPSVVAVQYFTGEVTIKGVGEATITATMAAHKNFEKAANISYTVSVVAKEVTEDNVVLSQQSESGVPEISVSVEAPVGTLTPAVGTDYEYALYDLEGNDVTAEEMAENPGDYLVVLTFFGNYDGFVEKTITVGPSVVQEENVELVDGTPYTSTVKIEAENVSYTRNFRNTSWQAYYLPFEVEVSALTADFDVARINNIHQWDDDEDGTIDRTALEVVYVRDGVLSASTPYLIRAKATGEKVITATDVTLLPATSESIDCSSTTDVYTFRGTYAGLEAGVMAAEGYYALAGGAISTTTSTTATLGSFRWYMDVTSRSASTKPAKLMLLVVGEDGTTSISNEQLTTNNEADACFDLAGRRIGKASRGVNIISGKKIIVK